MQLTDYIVALLREHNCVIVPDFGGFIANYKSAVIDPVQNRIVPPSKSVLFNPKLITNDGLLGNEISGKKGVTYPDALQFIADEVDRWQNELEKGERIEIGEIGFLFRQNGTITFEQSRDVNILLAAYGLSGVRFVNFKEKASQAEKEVVPVITESPVTQKQEPVKESAVETKEQPNEPVIIALNQQSVIEETEAVAEPEDEKVIPIGKKPRGKKLKYLAVAAAIPLLFYSYWIPIETDFLDTGEIQLGDFNPIRNSVNRSYKLRSEETFSADHTTDWKSWSELTENLSDHVEVYNYQFDDELYIPIKLDKTAVAETTPITEEVDDLSDAMVDNPYHIIGGCFSVKSNAENLVADLVEEGYPARILDLNKGLYRVSAGGYANRNEANDNLKGFKNAGFSGWILKK